MPFREEWFNGWRNGVHSDHDEATAWLYQRFGSVVIYYLIRVGKNKDPENLAYHAFWYAMEEMDLMVSGGQFEFDYVGAPPREGKVRGRHTNRELSIRNPIEWRGERQFGAFFRRLWIFRCRDFADEGVVEVAIDNGHEGQEGVISETEISVGKPFSKDKWLFKQKVSIVFLVRSIARASEQVRDAPRKREFLEATILYIKAKVAECNPNWKGKPSAVVEAPGIEDLLKDADLSEFKANGSEWRQFLMDRMRLSRAALDQLIHNCRTILKAILADWQDQIGEDEADLSLHAKRR